MQLLILKKTAQNFGAGYGYLRKLHLPFKKKEKKVSVSVKTHKVLFKPTFEY